MAAVRIRVDGRVLAAPEGGNLLEALLEVGVAMPHPCFHPALTCPASCRLCVARVAGPAAAPQLLTTCNRTVRAGLVVDVDVPEVAAARQSLTHDLLLRHPAACGVCERAGECELQELAHGHGPRATRAAVAPAGDRVALGPRLVLDRARCILCTRCVRFSAQISGTAVLAVHGAGTAARVEASAPVADEVAGNLLDLCPSGALSAPGERFQPPPWRLTGVASVCAGCATGCATRVDAGCGRVWRVTPRPAAGASPWLCDRGRWGWRGEGERLTGPRLAGGDASWDAALAAVADAMERASDPAVLLSPYLTSEEAYLLAQLAQRWGARLYLWQDLDPAGDRSYRGGLQVSARLGPNADGAAAAAAVTGQRPEPAPRLLARLAAGQVDAVYAVGGSLCGEGPGLQVRGDVFLAAQDACAAAHHGAAAVVLPGASAWTEKDGTFVDGAGRVQVVRAAAEPPPGARRDLWILAALWHGGPNRDSADQVFARLVRAAATAPFAGLERAALEAQSQPEAGVAYGGGWTSLLQRRGLVAVGDHARSR